jgi:hypothetical protein
VPSVNIKRFRLSAADIRPLAEGKGAGIASDHIMVDGKPVGFMYREAPDDSHDSGWRFLSGAESQEYMEDSENFAMYDVNTIANYDPSIVEYLDAPVGSAFGRSELGDFTRENMPDGTDA